MEDYSVWWKNKLGFSLKGSYERLEELGYVGLNIEEDILEELRKLWKENAPRKILLFS